MGNQGSEYEVIKVTADSGASDHVAPLTTARHIKIEETEASRNGLCYQAANGESISNIGQRNIKALTNEGEVVACVVRTYVALHLLAPTVVLVLVVLVALVVRW